MPAVQPLPPGSRRHQHWTVSGGSLLVLAAPHSPRCPSAHFQCTSSLPFSQEGFCICFTYPLLVFLSPTLKCYKICWKHPHFVTRCNLFLRKHTGGHLLFILTSQAQTEDMGFFEQVLFQSFILHIFFLLGFMIVQKYSSLHLNSWKPEIHV